MREKIFRDPVHDFITVRNPLLLSLIDSEEFQRLRRLRQLGTSFGTYHGAEHSRFGHCLGAMHVMGKVIKRLRESGAHVPEEVEVVAETAALLHDLGHGPLSHGLELVLTPGIHHEWWTRQVLLAPECEVHQLLHQADPRLAGAVVAVLEGTAPWPFVSSLVASQFDVDRMDYLLRDALFTGAFYGRFDLERLIHTVRLVDGQVVIQHKGIPTAEEYVLSRYYMYWQVYFHKTTRGQDLLLRNVWRRACEMYGQGALGETVPTLEPLLRAATGGAPVTVREYLEVDDYDVMYALKRWTAHPDPILRDLAGRFLHRRLLKPVFREPVPRVEPAAVEEAAEVLRRRGWDPEYYLATDRTSDVAYDYYKEQNGAPEAQEPGATSKGTAKGTAPMLALDAVGRPVEISQLSEIIRVLATTHRVAENVYVPGEFRDEVRSRITRLSGGTGGA